MRKIKYVIILAIVLFLAFGVFNFTNNSVQAAGDPDFIVEGVGIRTAGEKQGMRFKCRAYHPYFVSCGVYIAFGETTNIFFEDDIVNGKPVLKGETTDFDENGNYYVTLYNIPEECYTQKVSVLPFVKYNPAGSDVILTGDSPCIKIVDLADIAYKALNDGYSCELLEDVDIYISQNYFETIVSANQSINILSAGCVKDTYEIYQEFAKDWNKAYPSYQLDKTLTGDSLIAELNTKLIEDVSYESSKLYQFFYNNDEWYRFVEKVYSMGMGNEKLTDQAGMMISLDEPYVDYANWNKGTEFVYFLGTLFAMSDALKSSLGFGYSNIPDAKFSWFIADCGIYTTDFDGKTKIAKGSTYTLPALSSNANPELTSYYHIGQETYENVYAPGTTITVNEMESYSAYTKYNAKIIRSSSTIYYPTIQLALDNAQANDGILIGKNTYGYGDVDTYTVQCNNISIEGMDYENTIIYECKFVLNSNAYKDITFKNMTFDNSQVITQNIGSNKIENIKFNQITFNQGSASSSSINLKPTQTGNYMDDIQFTNCTFGGGGVISNPYVYCESVANLYFYQCHFNEYYSSGSYNGWPTIQTVSPIKVDGEYGMSGMNYFDNCSFYNFNAPVLNIIKFDCHNISNNINTGYCPYIDLENITCGHKGSDADFDNACLLYIGTVEAGDGETKVYIHSANISLGGIVFVSIPSGNFTYK